MKTSEQREGEAAFMRLVRIALISVVAVVVFGYWWGRHVVRPALGHTFESIVKHAK